MDTIDTYFPYSEYRPGQRHMLEIAAQVAREGGIAMIDAPTGSGKVECCGLSSGRKKIPEDCDCSPDRKPAHHVCPRT